MHAKLCIFRRAMPVAFIGSANFTDSGLGIDRPGNIELATTCEANEEITDFFETYWAMGKVDWDPNEFAPVPSTPPIEKSPIFRLLAYQADAVERLGSLYQANERGALLVLPTGSGKTVTVLRFLADYVFDRPLERPVLWLAPFHELNMQVMAEAHRLLHHAAPHARVQSELEHYARKDRKSLIGESDASPDLVFNTPESEHGTPLSETGYELIVIDEAHRGTGSNQRIPTILERNDNSFRLGITATPYRATDKVSVVERFGGNVVPDNPIERSTLESYFDPRFGQIQVLAKSPPSHHLTAEAKFPIRWSDPKLRLDSDKPLEAFVNPTANRSVAETWRSAFGRTLVFAFNRDHANKLAREFRRHHGPELRLQVAHGGKIPGNLDFVINPHSRTLSLFHRDEIRKRFRAAEIEVLISVDMYIAGLDFPQVETIFMSRPTFSSVRYNQMIGRGLRGPHFGGTEFLRVVDFCDQGEAHALSTQFLMNLDRAMSHEDHQSDVFAESWIRRTPPSVLRVSDADCLPRSPGVWAIYSPAAHNETRRWKTKIQDDLRTRVQESLRQRPVKRNHWIAFYPVDEIDDFRAFERVMRRATIKVLIQERTAGAIARER